LDKLIVLGALIAATVVHVGFSQENPAITALTIAVFGLLEASIVLAVMGDGMGLWRGNGDHNGATNAGWEGDGPCA
jgi:hypothetical protein